MSVIRRLAAILAVDVVGYSRLMGANEAGTAKAVRERREAATPTVRALGGQLVKTTGDGALLEFTSVVAAVECAILIQRMMAERNAALPDAERILYRIGVNLGDVLIDGDDILGDGVNVAARLEAICEPGGVCVSGSAFEHVSGRIVANFADLGEQSLKNIARGVRAYVLTPDAIVTATVEPHDVARESPRVALGHPEPPRLSIVVLPFTNIGDDPQQEYFVDGVTESLTTDLSRISGAFVIGRSTAFTYKGKGVDLKQLGRELNVRYVLEGSVQRGGNRVRVNVQMIEAKTGAHLWAERFDKPIADLFDMQDKIVARLANQLQAELIAAEARRADEAASPDSIDLVFQGRATLNRGLSPEMLAKARGLFERALELDPDNVEALVGLGTVDGLVAIGYFADDPAPIAAAAEANLGKALALAPNHAFAHFLMGSLLCRTNRPLRGMEELDRALAIDPNLASAHGAKGFAQIFLGKPEETEAHVLEALRLSPRDALVSMWSLHVGGAKCYLGEYEAALEWLRQSIDANRSNPWAHFYFSACLAHLGRFDEAHREVEAGLAIAPAFTLGRYRAGTKSDNPVYLARRDRVIEGMRLAGVPEG